MSVGVGTAIAIAGAATAGATVVGGVMSANAQKSAGEAQAGAAREQVQYEREALAAQIEARKQAVQLGQTYGSMSAGELMGIQRVLQAKQTAMNATLLSISKQQKQLDAVDPQVKAAGKNVFDLLTGANAKLLDPMMKLRDRQRTEMMNNLAGSMGPGYMTSSAGIEAMTKFDEATNYMVADVQQQALQTTMSAYGNLFGLQQQGGNAITAQTGEAYGRALLADQGVLQAEQYGQSRLANAVIGGFTGNKPNFEGPAQAQGAVVSTAGNPFAGADATGKMISNLGAGAGAVAGQYAGYQLFSNAFGGNSGYGGGSVVPPSSMVPTLPGYSSPNFGQIIAPQAAPMATGAVP